MGRATLTFRVTWRHRSRDHSIGHGQFSTGVSLLLTFYLRGISRYWDSNVYGPQFWPFKATWRHRSRDNSFRGMWFL